MKSRTMIRKQVYIEPLHDRMLKQRARQRGVTEAEIIREALDRVDSSAGERTVNVESARLAIAFMRSLARGPRPPNGRAAEKGLAAVRGWLPDDDPFFVTVDEIVDRRARHSPRTLPELRKRTKG